MKIVQNAWRICPKLHAANGRDAFSGEGARKHGGRFNSKGLAVAYASATLSLAALEFLVHADVQLLRTLPLVACEAIWPAELIAETMTELPPNWRDTPAPKALQTFGDEWIRHRRTAILFVPSAIVPRENNLLLNPDHPDFARVSFGEPEVFSYDPRLL